MLLSLKSLVQVDLPGNYFWLTDQTGKYDAIANPGGWGGQNPPLAKSALLVVAKRIDSFLSFVTTQIVYPIGAPDDTQLQWQINYDKDGWHRFWMVRLWVSNNGVVDIVGDQILGPGDLFYIPAQPGKVWMKTGSGASAFIQVTDFDDALDTGDAANAQVFSEAMFFQNIERKKNDLYKKVFTANLSQDSDTARKYMDDIKDIRARVNAAQWAFDAGLKSQANDIVDSIIDDYKINYPAPLVPVPVTPVTPYSPFLFSPAPPSYLQVIILQMFQEGLIPTGNLPTGGTIGQFLRKLSSANSDASWQTLLLAMVQDVSISASVLNALPASLASEATSRAAADTTLQTHIDSEATNRAAADASETAARAAADLVLLGDINSEATTRAAADTTLQTNITAEAAARVAADALKADKSQGAWTTIALTNSWSVVNGDTPQYRQDQFGRVWLRGTIAPGSADAFCAAGTLPAFAARGALSFLTLVAYDTGADALSSVNVGFNGSANADHTSANNLQLDSSYSTT